MMSNRHLNIESLCLYADHVFGYENWSNQIKNLCNASLNVLLFRVFKLIFAHTIFINSII